MVPRTLFQGGLDEKRSNTPRDVRRQERLPGCMPGFKDGLLDAETGCPAWGGPWPQDGDCHWELGCQSGCPEGYTPGDPEGILMFAFWRRWNEQK